MTKGDGLSSCALGQFILGSFSRVFIFHVRQHHLLHKSLDKGGLPPKTIRRLDNRVLASVPIVAMTANAFEEDKQEALRSGMDGHIAKPIEIDRLIRQPPP